MFALPAVGLPMAIAHYLGALLVGLLFRFYGLRDPERTPDRPARGNMLARAVDALVKARQEDGRGLGQILGDAVRESVQTLWMICGFIVLMATIVRIVESVGLYSVLAAPLEWLFARVGLDPDLVRAAVAGLFEIDLGTLVASRADADLVQRLAMAGAIVAWSGLSVHGQIASVLTGTDIRMGPYMAARLAHAIFAFVATLFLVRGGSLVGFEEWIPTLGGLPTNFAQPGFWEVLLRSLGWAAGVPVGLAVCGGVAAILTGGLRTAGFYTRR